MFQIFDQCDQSRAKHEIWLDESDVEVSVGVLEDGLGSGMVAVAAGPMGSGSGSSPTVAAGVGKKPVSPFIIYSRQRKFHLAGQTKGDSEEWLTAILQYSRSQRAAALAAVNRMGPPPVHGRPRSNTVISMFQNFYQGGRSKPPGGDDDDDARILHHPRQWDMVVIMEMMGEALQVLALSFCSEQILTPYELTVMGTMTLPVLMKVFLSLREEPVRKRRAPLTTKEPKAANSANGWNERYQRILAQRPEDHESKLRQDVQLLELIGAFEEAAIQHAIQMVDDYHLKSAASVPASLEPGSPSLVSVDGIILHFVCDYEVVTPDQVELAMSKSSSELRSIDALNRTRCGLQTALMMLSTIKDSKTKAIFDLSTNPPITNDRASEWLMGAARSLNLKPHGVQIGDDRRVNVGLGANVEVHHDPSLQFNYAVNLYGIMPLDFMPPNVQTPTSSPHRLSSSQNSSPDKSSLAMSDASPNPTRRLRPEFLKIYTASSISSDAFTHASGCGRRERGDNDLEASRACKFLREVWIPKVIGKFDSLEIRPVDSRTIAVEMHRAGINVRYLVGATQIEEETRTYACNMFTSILCGGERSAKFFEEKLRPEILKKFDFDMDYDYFSPYLPPRLHLTNERIHPPPPFSEENRQAYVLARHFKSLGPLGKLSRSDASALRLTEVAAHYNATGRFEEARRYATAAMNASLKKHLRIIESIGALTASDQTLDPSLANLYETGVATVEWHCGPNSPMAMALHDRKNHVVTAGYLTRQGVLLSQLKQTDVAISRLTEALNIHNSLSSSAVLIAEVHGHLADALDAKGDLDAAIVHAQKCRKLREKSLGQHDPRSVASFMQVSMLVLKPYAGYTGVLTPAIRVAYREAISCYEKVFRFVKMAGGGKRESGGWSSSASVVSVSTHVTGISAMESNASGSVTSIPYIHAPPVAGPGLEAPFGGPPPPVSKSILHKLTKQIVALKLALLDSPKHKEVVRTLRASAKAENEAGNDAGFDPASAREVVIRMAAVSPSIYLDGVLARIDDDDASAVEELAIALLLTESETVGLNST
ncbi:hypothetical protein BC829DRAFT_421374 [Chytridium lagenaria]|nr:hypothetical protein BC829DRAFT_421374 [Chytridium lagenaria]